MKNSRDWFIQLLGRLKFSIMLVLYLPSTFSKVRFRWTYLSACLWYHIISWGLCIRVHKERGFHAGTKQKPGHVLISRKKWTNYNVSSWSVVNEINTNELIEEHLKILNYSKGKTCKWLELKLSLSKPEIYRRLRYENESVAYCVLKSFKSLNAMNHSCWIIGMCGLTKNLRNQRTEGTNKVLVISMEKIIKKSGALETKT